MQVVIRKYAGKGSKELFDLLEQNAAEITKRMGAVNGLVSYTLARTSDGGFSVTVCQDKAGIDQGAQIARDWISQNAASIGAAAPEIVAGNVIANA